MNICLVGNNLTSLILSKTLINSGAILDIFYFKNKKNSPSIRTIGISKSNIDFINNNICQLKLKNFNKISKIQIFSEDKQKILDFSNKEEMLFSLLKADELYNFLFKNLKKSKFFKIKKTNEGIFKKKFFLQSKYDLIINCESNNFLNRKYFNNKLKKKYNNTAFTTLIAHQTIKNCVAKQYFTSFGPLAFLPLSKNTTSVVFSSYNTKEFNKKNLKDFIINHKGNLKIKKFANFEKINLNFLVARKYYHDKILLFGDGLHQIHPLAGQGFNMILRDIKILLKLINEKNSLGISIDQSLLNEFEENTKSKNTLFAHGINIVQNFFRIKKNFKNQRINGLISKIGNSNKINRFLTEAADKGIIL